MQIRKYGFIITLMMSISATVGSSLLIIYGNVAQMSGFNPWFMIISWIIGGILVLPQMLILGETARSYPENGSTYMWLKKGNWKGIAFWFGWVHIFMISAIALSATSMASGILLSEFFNITNEWLIKLMAITVMVLLAATHIFIKNSSGISQIIFTSSKFIPVSIVILVALIYGTTHSFSSVHSNSNNSMGTILFSQFLLIPAIATTMFAFSGMESVTYMAGEVKKPQQNVFKALLWATIVVIVLYTILLIVLLAIADPSKWADSNGSYTNVWFAAIMNSPNIPKAWAYTFSTLTIFVFLGSLNAHLFYQARLVQKIALEKDLFSFFTKTSKKTHTPYTALGLIVFLAIVYMIWNELFSIMTYGVLANTILKFIGIGFSTKLRYGNYAYKRLFNNFWYFTFLIISTIGFFVCVIGSLVANYWLAQTEHNMWVFWKLIIVMVVMFLGYPFYYLKLYINKLQATKKKQIEVTKISAMKNIEGI